MPIRRRRVATYNVWITVTLIEGTLTGTAARDERDRAMLEDRLADTSYVKLILGQKKLTSQQIDRLLRGEDCGENASARLRGDGGGKGAYTKLTAQEQQTAVDTFQSFRKMHSSDSKALAELQLIPRFAKVNIASLKRWRTSASAAPPPEPAKKRGRPSICPAEMREKIITEVCI